MKPFFTPEELADMAAADAEIDASFSLTNEDIRRSREADKAAKMDRLPPAKKKKSAYWRAYYEANREEIAAKRKRTVILKKECIAPSGSRSRDTEGKILCSHQCIWNAFHFIQQIPALGDKGCIDPLIGGGEER